jgi:hypothetical protein
MPHDLTTYQGGLAAFLASLSYVPQVRKAWALIRSRLT